MNDWLYLVKQEPPRRVYSLNPMGTGGCGEGSVIRGHHVMLRRKGLLVMFGFWLECHEARPTCSCWGSLSGSLRCRWWQSRSPPTETDAWLEGMTTRRWSTIQHQGKRWLPSRGRIGYVSLNLGRVWSAEWRVQRVYCLMVWSQLQECPDMISVWELAEWLALVSACEREKNEDLVCM